MENTRSILSRFSGLALFLLAVVVVGLLVFFTVRTADDDATSEDTGVTSSEQTREPARPDIDSEPSVTGDQTGTGSVAADTDEDLPNTGPEDAILPALGIALVAWQIAAYRQSRRLVKDSLGS